ncbi:hypothetical protein V6N12_005090 [Hibiscus sabdariffa]|uniref:Uncharacterized protein n=1 Tax=Hibiscus sabdariffa TaxID=183260 RepID=A0ABR2CQS1_9ROSI
MIDRAGTSSGFVRPLRNKRIMKGRKQHLPQKVVVYLDDIEELQSSIGKEAEVPAVMSRGLSIEEQLFSFPHVETIEHLLHDAAAMELGNVNLREDP